MSGEIFLEWFENILPKLENNAVIVMDNAPYHSMKLEKVPNTKWKKSDIIEWLKSKNETVDTTMLKNELLQSVALIKHNFTNKYIIDEKANKQNKTVLRLSPYHCELNPIEMVWSMVKGYVKTHNTTFKIDDVKILLEQGLQRVTAEHWSNFVRHVVKEKEKIWKVDNIAHRTTEMAPLIIRLDNENDLDTDHSDLDDLVSNIYISKKYIYFLLIAFNFHIFTIFTFS